MFEFDELEAVDPSPEESVKLTDAVTPANVEEVVSKPAAAAVSSTCPVPETRPTPSSPSRRAAATSSAKTSGAPRAKFEIFGEQLTMYLKPDASEPTPFELAQIWEHEWGLAHAGRVKFVAPPGSEQKFLIAREDVLPPWPAVTRLEGLGPILQSIANSMRQRAADPGSYLMPIRAAGQRPSETPKAAADSRPVRKTAAVRRSAVAPIPPSIANLSIETRPPPTAQQSAFAGSGAGGLGQEQRRNMIEAAKRGGYVGKSINLTNPAAA